MAMVKEMKYIKLTQNKLAIVDDKDFEFINQWKWHITKKGYPARTIHTKRPNRIDKTIFMHRLINKTPISLQTDHINRDKLDNRRNNLRSVTNGQNQRNKNKQINNISGHIGISKRPNGKWWSRIYYEGKMFSLGCYLDIKDAIKARKLGEEKIWVK